MIKLDGIPGMGNFFEGITRIGKTYTHRPLLIDTLYIPKQPVQNSQTAEVGHLVGDPHPLGATSYRPADATPPKGWLAQVYSEWEEDYHLWIEKRFNNLFSSKRHQYLQILAIETGGGVSPEARWYNRRIALNAGIVILTMLKQWVYPPLILPTLLLALYTESLQAKRGWQTSIQRRRLSIDAMIAIFTVGTYLSGYFMAGGLFGVLFSVVQRLIWQTRDQSRKKLINVFGQQLHTVWVLVDGVEIEQPFERLRAGDLVVVQAGQMIPADGVITQGAASVDQQRLTGESQAAEKSVGDEVLAATVVLRGRLYIQVKKAGKDTVAAQIGDMLKQTTEHHLIQEERGIRLAERWVLPSFGLAGLALLLRGPHSAIAIFGNIPGLSMVLMSPLTLLTYLNLLARQHILVKDGRSLELLQAVDTVVFDKTGTLTLEQFQVCQIHVCATVHPTQVLRYAAAAEQRQTHPLAKAILAEAQAHHLSLPSQFDTHYELGYGVKVWLTPDGVNQSDAVSYPDQTDLPSGRATSVHGAMLSTLGEEVNALPSANGHAPRVWVGSARFMALEGLNIPEILGRAYTAGHAQGHSCVFVAVDEQVIGLIELQPVVRPEAQAVIADLHQRGLKTFIISGDQTEPTRKLAAELGIEHYFANVLPMQKAALVAQLHQEGRTVCFVGDGINDALALKKAHVSISLRGATNVATDTAQIVLMDQSLRQLPTLFDLTDEMHRTLQSIYLLTTVPPLVLSGGVFLGVTSIPLIFATRSVFMLINTALAIRPIFKPSPSVASSEADEATVTS